MSPNALAIVFAPNLVRTNAPMTAQQSLAQVHIHMYITVLYVLLSTVCSYLSTFCLPCLHLFYLWLNLSFSCIPLLFPLYILLSHLLYSHSISFWLLLYTWNLPFPHFQLSIYSYFILSFHFVNFCTNCTPTRVQLILNTLFPIVETRVDDISAPVFTI